MKKIIVWFPAVILPSATGLQLATMIREGSAAGVSPVTWGMFLLANLGALHLGEPRSRLERGQMVAAFGLTAALDAAIIAACFLL